MGKETTGLRIFSLVIHLLKCNLNQRWTIIIQYHPVSSFQTEAADRNRTQSAMIRINPFPILLNNLSNELENKDLQNLKNVCAEYIPGGERENIRIGWDVFNVLLRQNVIGSEPEKIASLLAIIKELRRRDLVRMIKEHIQENYENPEMILDCVRSVSDSLRGPKIAYPSNRNQSDEQGSTPCCVQDCSCCKLTCYSSPCCDLPCCCVVLAILFAIFTVAAILAWYSDIPEVTRYLKSSDDWWKAGRYIIGVLALFAFCFAFCRIYLLLRSKRNETVEMAGSHDNQCVNDEAIRRLVSVSASNSGYTTPELPGLTREGSFSSNPATASCSLSSIASRIPRVSESETAPDDGLQNGEGDNVDFFTPKSSRNVSVERVGKEIPC